MRESDITESEFTWSTIGPTGNNSSTKLSRYIRNFTDFARADIATGDNDPTYWAITGARHKWGQKWAIRFCVAMLTYYHVGTAAEAADEEGPAFWEYLRDRFAYAPRGSGRRHFRGSSGLGALARMKQVSPDPNDFFKQFPQVYRGVVDTCNSELLQFGPYFQLKICDYMDRCLTMPIANYDGLANNLSSVPAKAAKKLHPEMSPAFAFDQACEDIAKLNILAPPLFDRFVGPAEVESCLCDWYHIGTGTNWIGSDNLAKRAAFVGYGDKALEMIGMMPPAISKTQFRYVL